MEQVRTATCGTPGGVPHCDRGESDQSTTTVSVEVNPGAFVGLLPVVPRSRYVPGPGNVTLALTTPVESTRALGATAHLPALEASTNSRGPVGTKPELTRNR